MTGFYTLLHKELLRFWKVSFQTVLAPVLTTLLYLLIFSHVLEDHVQAYPGVAYTVFLIPGLVMMAVLQNAFANSSSSLIQSRVTGNIVFMLLSPLSYREIFLAYVLASIARGLMVGLGVYLVTLGFFEVPLRSFPWVLLFALLGSAAGCAGRYRRHLGRKIRSACRIPELHHSATDVSVRRVLFNPLAATVLAKPVPFQSVFLHDRRVSLRFLRRVGCFALLQFCNCGDMLSGSIMADIANAENRLQAAALIFTFFANRHKTDEIACRTVFT